MHKYKFLRIKLVSVIKNVVFPSLILIIAAVIGVYFRPLMIIDETRYISVAWEMFDKHSFLVPLINGEPYHHKPPLLFWLMHLDWFIFGVNELSVRFIPLLFSLGSVLLSYLIYKELWVDDKKGASLIGWVLAGTMMYAFYSSLLMFDVMLGFWVLLGILGIVRVVNYGKKGDYFLIVVAVWFGILAKGPVVVAHLLPMYLFLHFWAKEKASKDIYIGGMVAVFAGIVLALVWGIPAAIKGGEVYAHAIFWGQAAGRVAHSFAHSRPFWWYLPLIPLLTFPWFFYGNVWRSLMSRFSNGSVDLGIRFLLVWIVGTLVIFSLISGKQVHYIVPEIPAFALLATRLISTRSEGVFSVGFIGGIYFLVGVLFAVAPYKIPQYLQHYVDVKAFWISAVMLVGVGLYFLLKRFISQEKLVKQLAFSPLIVIFAVHFILSGYLKDQDLTNFAQNISKLQKDGVVIVHDGKYNDQFHFLGRLHEDIKVVHSKKELQEYIKNHPDSVIITYRKRKEYYKKDNVIATTKFRTQNIIMIKASDWDTL